MYTIDDARKWANDNSIELDADRIACDDQSVQMLNRIIPDKSKCLWDAGCWLAEKLRERGANDEQVSAIQMAMGQRAFCGDTWKAAVDYANEFALSGDTKEKGGEELASKLNYELVARTHRGKHD